MEEESLFRQLPWISIGPMLNSGRIAGIVGVPGNPSLIYASATVGGVLYIGTELGVYVSLDNGVEWISLSNGLPAVSVDDLLVHPRENELVIGTYGRGIYKMDISPIQQINDEILSKDLHLFDIKPAKLPKRRDYDGDWFLETARYRKSAYKSGTSLFPAGRYKLKVSSNFETVESYFDLLTQ